MKFNIKVIGKNAFDNAKPIAVATAGVIATQKFLDFKTLFPNVDPKKWFIQHEGAVKVGAVIVTLAMFSKMPPLFKWLLWGVAIQGAIKETRQLTMNDQGKAFFDQIGAGEYDQAIEEMANQVKKEAGANVNMNGITDNSYSTVGDLRNPSMTLMDNAQTGVGGIGMSDFEDNNWN